MGIAKMETEIVFKYCPQEMFQLIGKTEDGFTFNFPIIIPFWSGKLWILSSNSLK